VTLLFDELASSRAIVWDQQSLVLTNATLIAIPSGVSCDEHRGLIAFTAGHQVHVIGANQWLADTFIWRPDLHRYAPSSIKQAVSTMTMIRSLVDESAMSMIPNELLFEIFSFL